MQRYSQPSIENTNRSTESAATVVYLLLVVDFFFLPQCRTSLSCLVKEFGIYIPHIREQMERNLDIPDVRTNGI